MTFAERLLALSELLGYRRPRYLTEHAVERLVERWGDGHEQARADLRRALIESLPKARLVRIDGSTRCTVWMAGEVPLVVAQNGAVKTVLDGGMG